MHKSKTIRKDRTKATSFSEAEDAGPGDDASSLGPGAPVGGAGGPNNDGEGAGAPPRFTPFFFVLLGAGAGTSCAVVGAATGEGGDELTGTGAGGELTGTGAGGGELTGVAAGGDDAGGEEVGVAAVLGDDDDLGEAMGGDGDFGLEEGACAGDETGVVGADGVAGEVDGAAAGD